MTGPCETCSRSIQAHPGPTCPVYFDVGGEFRAGCGEWTPRNIIIADAKPIHWPTDSTKPVPSKRTRKGPNKTELAFRYAHLSRVEARYKGMSVMVAGHRYTPDWVVLGFDGIVTCYEVKGSYRLQSHGRSRLAFDAAREAWPCFRWVWAERQKDGTWSLSE